MESDSPELVCYGEGKNHDYRNYPHAVRVYVAVQNRYPDFSQCDYAMTFLHLDEPRHLRVPVYVFDSDLDALLRKKEGVEQIVSEHRQFCAFVVSNGSRRADRRLQFFHKLNAVRGISSGGRILNNVGGQVGDKMSFLRDHRFNLCFENHLWPGYTTEKIAHAFAAGCIPIYWGNPAVAADFNPRSFINVSDYSSDDTAIQHILEVADSRDLQLKYLREACFLGGQETSFYDIDRMAAFLKRVVETPKRKRPFFCGQSALFRIRRQFRLF